MLQPVPQSDQLQQVSGPRDVLRSATFENGSQDSDGFAADSGVWSVENGVLKVEPTVLGGDAVSVFHVNQYLPTYFEITAIINGGKPTAGYKSNAYAIFDYQSEYDFKFAGVNVSIDKIQIGYRDAEGWHVVSQTPDRLKPNRNYSIRIALNGTTVTAVVNPAASTNSWTALPAGTGSAVLYGSVGNRYLKTGTTNYYYCWTAGGEVYTRDATAEASDDAGACRTPP